MFGLFDNTNKKFKLTIHNGHRNVTNGQTGTSGVTSTGVRVNEVDIIDQIYYKIKARIDADKFLSSVIMLAYDDSNIRNGVDSDYFIALHVDGASDTSVRGGFIDDNPNDQVYEQSIKFGKSVADSYFPQIGIPYRNGQTPNTTYYYAFNQTAVYTKQFIIELGMASNVQDMDLLVQYDRVAELLLRGMIAYWEQYDEIYRYRKNQLVGGGSTSNEVESLKLRVAELQMQNEQLLAAGNGSLLNLLQDKTRSIKSKLQEALSLIDALKL